MLLTSSGGGAKVLTSGNPSCKYHERLWEEVILLTLGNNVAYFRGILVTSGNPSRTYFQTSSDEGGGQSTYFKASLLKIP